MISIVITIYGNLIRIRKALEMVKKQTYQDFEIIVVDGANREKCRKEVEEQGHIYIGIPNDLGPPYGVQQARNLGIHKAKGKYIAFLDEDDRWTPDKLEKQLKEIKKTDVGLVSCYSEFLLKNGESHVERKKTNPSYHDLLRNFEISPTSSLLARKDVLMEIGGFNVFIRGMHEYDLALRVARNGYRIICIPEVLLYKNQDFEVQLGSIYWKIAEQFEFLRLYRKDILKHIGWRGALYNVLKLWSTVCLYATVPVTKDRIWKILAVVKEGF